MDVTTSSDKGKHEVISINNLKDPKIGINEKVLRKI